MSRSGSRFTVDYLERAVCLTFRRANIYPADWAVDEDGYWTPEYELRDGRRTLPMAFRFYFRLKEATVTQPGLHTRSVKRKLENLSSSSRLQQTPPNSERMSKRGRKLPVPASPNATMLEDDDDRVYIYVLIPDCRTDF